MKAKTSELIRLGNEALVELERALILFPRFNSAHEGYAVIFEALDELWEEVKNSRPGPERTANMRKEAIQVAAMALRFVHDVTP